MLTFHSYWPILSLEQDGLETEAELRRSLTVLSLVLSRRRPFIVLIEAGASWESLPALAPVKTAWWETHQADLYAYCRAVAFVSPTGAAPAPEPHYQGCATAAFADTRPALTWAMARLLDDD